MKSNTLHIIGAGLAGCEAAWQAAKQGISVVLYDMKPHRFSPAHKSKDFAELVCSNSLRSDDFEHNAVGVLHQELRLAGSLIMQCADETKVPAGGALAVDRDGFSRLVTQKISQNPLIKIENKEFKTLPDKDFGTTIIATGPLTTEELGEDIKTKIGSETLSFYDAIAPVIFKESIDFSKAWYQSRYDKGDKFDYINCPMSQEQYYTFVDELIKASRADFHEFEDASYFDGCLPIEIMAERGIETLVFGPMKPVGLTNPHNPEKPYAIVQLRQDNKEDTLRNMVGFQTKLKHGEQKRIFSTIPGLENAEFARLGGIHKNTFIKSPALLDETLRLKTLPHISFAGQISGCEGYVESAAIGFLAGYFRAMELNNKKTLLPPRTSALGSILSHLIDDTDLDNYQPMNINFGIFPTILKDEFGKNIKGLNRKKAYADRALRDIKTWIEEAL